MNHTFILNKRKIIVFATIKGIEIEKDFKFILDTVVDIPPQIMFVAEGLVGMDFLLHFNSINFDFNKKIIVT